MRYLVSSSFIMTRRNNLTFVLFDRYQVQTPMLSLDIVKTKIVLSIYYIVWIMHWSEFSNTIVYIKKGA